MNTKLSLTLLSSVFAFTALHAAEPAAAAADALPPAVPARQAVSRLTPEVLASLGNTTRSLFGEFEAVAAPAAQNNAGAPMNIDD